VPQSSSSSSSSSGSGSGSSSSSSRVKHSNHLTLACTAGQEVVEVLTALGVTPEIVCVEFSPDCPGALLIRGGGFAKFGNVRLKFEARVCLPY
jgi:hypothetical protein